MQKNIHLLAFFLILAFICAGITPPALAGTSADKEQKASELKKIEQKVAEEKENKELLLVI